MSAWGLPEWQVPPSMYKRLADLVRINLTRPAICVDCFDVVEINRHEDRFHKSHLYARCGCGHRWSSTLYPEVIVHLGGELAVEAYLAALDQKLARARGRSLRAILWRVWILIVLAFGPWRAC